VEQNTDRMWWTIGAIVIGAAIIVSLLSGMSNMFNNIGTHSKLMELMAVESLVSTNENAKTVYDQWSEKYIITTDAGTFVNSSDDSSVTTATSESQGYGMLLTATAQNGTEETFDKLYNYYMNHRGHDTNLMAWQQKYIGGSVENDDNNATDGDIFIAESLIQAAKRWPNKKLEYATQAKNILTDILKYNYNDKIGILTVSNWATSNTKEWTVFRTADVTPVFFKHFEILTGEKNWHHIYTNMIKYTKDVSSSTKSNLVPDFINVKNGKGEPVDYAVMWDNEASFYGWSAIRVPTMLSFGTVPTEATQLVTPMINFLEKEEPLYALYNLDGTPAVNYSSKATLDALNYAQYKTQNKDLPDYNLPNGGYYTDTLYALSRVVK
jgi:endo-1,4-beta-D-glucanase Y